MRNLLFVLFTLSTISISCTPKAKIEVKCMTFNVRVSFADDGKNSWKHRKSIVLNTIKKNSPDILCVQESTPEVIEYICENFTQYRCYGVGRDSVHTNRSESCHIFYNKTLFSIDSLNSGTFWYSATPKVAGSKSWEAAYTRICTYARLQALNTQKSLYVYNNHWDHVSEQARDSSAVLLMKQINSRSFPYDDCIVTGDFNANEYESAIQYLTTKSNTNPLPLKDSYRILHPAVDSTDNTMHKFSGVAKSRIDYIFFQENDKIKVKSALIESYNENQRYPSDHFPVVIEFKKTE